jgi:hypothetical protein
VRVAPREGTAANKGSSRRCARSDRGAHPSRQSRHLIGRTAGDAAKAVHSAGGGRRVRGTYAYRPVRGKAARSDCCARCGRTHRGSGLGGVHDATTFHCELVFARPSTSDDFDILLDEETDPRVLDVADLDRHGRDIPALQRLLAHPVELNVFVDGMQQ